MWNDPLKVQPPAKKVVAPKAKPAAKKKSKPKPKVKSTTKLEKEVALLKEQSKTQTVLLNRLTDIVAELQLGTLHSSSVK